MPDTAIHEHTESVAELLALKVNYLVPCVYHFYRRPPKIMAGEGAYLVDDRGRRYLDCFTGVTVMSAGHCNPEIIEPAIAQMRTLQHTTSIYLTEPMLRLAERIATIAPGNLSRSFFCASGSEAVEGALMTAMLHTGRQKVVAMTNSLHGRTRFAMNVTGLDIWRTDPHPMADVLHVPFGDADTLSQCLARYGADVAAVIGEPIQGNGGIIEPDAGYWPRVRQLCDAHGALLVLDEIQTGMNRTGRWFASEHWDVVPDVMAISKALGNGFPIAAFVTTNDIAASYTRPGASTYGGNPVSAAAALAVIDFHERHNLGGRAVTLGDQLHVALERAAQRIASASPPRGRGLMLGLPIGDAEHCDNVLETLKDRGVLVGKTGPGRDVLTFLPPLTLTDTQMETLIDVLDQTLV